MDLQQLKRRIRLRDLETFVAVVEAGGIRKAGQQMHLSQPAVSKAVHALEEALGVTLLERGRRGVDATVFGTALVRRSKAIFDELQGTLQEFDHLADPSAGEVHLGSMKTLHAGLVSVAVDQLQRRHPRMKFVLESGQSLELIEYFLRERRIDLAVARPLTLPLPLGIEGEPLFHEQMKVVVGREHRFARRRRIALVDLIGENWILSQNELMPASPLAQAFTAAGLPMPERLVVSGSLNTRYQLLPTGRFVSLMPHSLLSFAQPRSLLHQLPIASPMIWSTPTMILTLQGRTLGPAPALFLATIRELSIPLAARLLKSAGPG